MKQLLLVMAGGTIGAVLRYGIGAFVSYDAFPYATLLVNMLGCFLLGWLLTLGKVKKKLHPDWSLLLGTGLLGSFTTFSAFSFETVQLLENDMIGRALIYVTLSIGAGLILAYAGVKLALRDGGEKA
ncbi:putative fluoride ion transporter CrcB [Lentibacillus sp. JNUCC-1]|uniref:fluoride efflux transporter CrcB n=1 Tax=Lentibacillus sp. JNUCC-1 TaxID=2654513 RepID=UPI0012E6FFBA|nr:fluoride efflux transporter CrcB [Lentibacillus sp. JNUCC-1]MUV36612.1 putative fluoride ion transporter CrcB [Lentibacillus sp. JNUCC-1]